MTKRRLEECSTPEGFVQTLRDISQGLYEDAAELDGAWQDSNAGRPWRVIANELERAIERINNRS